MPHPSRKFEQNIFINCPFDDKYYPLLRPLLFTVAYLRFTPRMALETSDSAETRLDKICELIKSCRYSVHDLSRLKADAKGEFSRLNMPFELGLDYGAKRFSSRLKTKRFPILEEHAYDYRRALSDISGVDIKNHGNDPIKVVRAIRNWFVETVGLKDVDNPSVIWEQFNYFASDFNTRRRAEGYSRDDLDMCRYGSISASSKRRFVRLQIRRSVRVFKFHDSGG